jgi:hypothetical protein
MEEESFICSERRSSVSKVWRLKIHYAVAKT